MLIPSLVYDEVLRPASLSRRVNANSQHVDDGVTVFFKLIKKGEC